MPRARATKKKAARTMSAEHKQALATGREEGRAVRAYLEALDRNRPRRGRRRTPAGLERRLAKIEQELPLADPLRRVQLIQERLDLRNELAGAGQGDDLSALEDAFAAVAKSYGERKGITYAAWREAGVQAALLKRAGIGRSVA